jgi:ubiquinone/menaquinone biosynthesis C-methylase UbiE
MAWVVLVASAAAVALTGIAATTIILGSLSGPAPPAGLWVRFLAAGALTVASLSLRSLRWVFLLRRAEIRIPIRDAYIGYFSGLSLLFTPLLIGEIAVRAAVLRARGKVPVSATVVVNVWERLLDVAALGVIGGVLTGLQGRMDLWIAGLAAIAVLMALGPVRRTLLDLLQTGVTRIVSVFESAAPGRFSRLALARNWFMALAASLGVWLLPGVGFLVIARAWPHDFSLIDAVLDYVASTAQGLGLAPAGIIVTGSRMIESLERTGFSVADASMAALAVRLATVGVATMLGVLFVAIHLRTRVPGDTLHFDQIADAYDVQIPEQRRLALLDRKTVMMRDALARLGAGRRGLDVGCGQGTYVARMRELGFDVHGIDASAAQVKIAGRNAGQTNLIDVGSVLNIPAPDAAYDFLYVINVLHHLGSVEEQRRAFAELLRVLRPGGVLFVHEINTRNILFRFYMSYVFPSLNLIDEGVERWLLPNRFGVYTDVPLAEVRYFTFFPDFLPQGLVGLLSPLERWLERSSLNVYSAHYMAVFRKGGV